jgi:enoyl-CoA hydratase
VTLVNREGVEGYMAREEEIYFNMCWRWRNLPKPVLAAAQGR